MESDHRRPPYKGGALPLSYGPAQRNDNKGEGFAQNNRFCHPREGGDPEK